MSEIELVWDAEVRVTESPVWDRANRRLLFGDLRNGRIFGFGVDDARRQVWDLPGPLGSFGLCASGRLVVGLTRSVILFDLDDQSVTTLSPEIDEPDGNYFNDGKVGPDGCFWVGTHDARRDHGDVVDGNGQLYRISPDGTMEVKASGYATPNGLSWTPDGKKMFHSDSHRGYVDLWDFDLSKGDISNRHRFLDLANEDGRPDGAATDSDGNYWSAGVSAGCLNQFSLDGKLLNKIETPCPAPTMPCFADEWLFFTSNKRMPGADLLGRTINVGGLFKMAAPVAGAPVGIFADR